MAVTRPELVARDGHDAVAAVAHKEARAPTAEDDPRVGDVVRLDLLALHPWWSCHGVVETENRDVGRVKGKVGRT